MFRPSLLFLKIKTTVFRRGGYHPPGTFLQSLRIFYRKAKNRLPLHKGGEKATFYSALNCGNETIIMWRDPRHTIMFCEAKYFIAKQHHSFERLFKRTSYFSPGKIYHSKGSAFGCSCAVYGECEREGCRMPLSSFQGSRKACFLGSEGTMERTSFLRFGKSREWNS